MSAAELNSSYEKIDITNPYPKFMSKVNRATVSTISFPASGYLASIPMFPRAIVVGIEGDALKQANL